MKDGSTYGFLLYIKKKPCLKKVPPGAADLLKLRQIYVRRIFKTNEIRQSSQTLAFSIIVTLVNLHPK